MRESMDDHLSADARTNVWYVLYESIKYASREYMGRYPVDFTYCSRSALAKAEENKTIRGEAQEVGVRGAVAKS